MKKETGLYKWLVLLFSLGALISFYLLYSKVSDTSVICPNSGCDEVAKSPYSMMFGIPVAAWGVFYYLVMLVTGIQAYKVRSEIWFKALGAGIFWGVLYSIYLRYLEIAKIGAFCIWCWGSVVVILLVAILYIILFNERKKGISKDKES